MLQKNLAPIKALEPGDHFIFLSRWPNRPGKSRKSAKMTSMAKMSIFENCEFRAKREVKKRNLVPQFPRAKREAEKQNSFHQLPRTKREAKKQNPVHQSLRAKREA